MEPKVKTGWEGALWGFGGLLVGGAVVFLALNSRDQEAPVGMMRRTPPAASPPVAPPVVPDQTPATPVLKGDPTPAVPAPTQRPGPELGGTLPFVTPPLGGTAPMKVDVPETGIRDQEVQLARLNVYTSDAANARDEILAYARSKGAQARIFVDYGNAEREPSEGLLVMLPDKDAEGLVQYVQSKNGNVAEQRYRIAPAARQARIQDEAQAALFALKAKRQKLLVKYLEDADPVKEVEEAIVKAADAIKRLRISDEQQSLTAVKVTFGPRG